MISIVSTPWFDAARWMRRNSFSPMPAPAVVLLDREGRLGVDVPSERRLLAPDRGVRPQFRRADEIAVDEGAVQQVALAEAVLGVMNQEVVGHPAAKPLVPAARIEAQQVVAEGFHVRGPKPPDFHVR